MGRDLDRLLTIVTFPKPTLVIVSGTTPIPTRCNFAIVPSVHFMKLQTLFLFVADGTFLRAHQLVHVTILAVEVTITQSAQRLSLGKLSRPQ